MEHERFSTIFKDFFFRLTFGSERFVHSKLLNFDPCAMFQGCHPVTVLLFVQIISISLLFQNALTFFKDALKFAIITMIHKITSFFLKHKTY